MNDVYYILFPQRDKLKTVRKIERFGALSVGWHYGIGGPIDDDIIQSAKATHEFLLMLALTKTDAFPGQHGEVMVTAYHRGHYANELPVFSNQSL